jgi:competence protein ComEC
VGHPTFGWVEAAFSTGRRKARGEVRLLIDARMEGVPGAMRVRVNLPLEEDRPGLAEGATVRLRARLMPPAPPMLPGGYDFARAAWFQGLPRPERGRAG